MQEDRTQMVEFGWFMPGSAVPGRPELPLVVDESATVLPFVAQHFDSIWVPDHLYAFTEPADGWMECWTTMTWLSASYPRLRVGSIVMGVGYRSPALLAKMAATLHVLSGGRLIMGIGAGWREPEYGAYGYPFPPARVRIEELDEAVQTMRLMWTEQVPTFHGRHFTIEGAYCEPRPDPPIPVMIGGSGEKLLLPLVARLADIWDRYHGGPLNEIDVEEYRRKLGIVHTHAAAAGRDPGSIRQSFTIENGQLPTSKEDSANWVKHVRPLFELGVRQFIVGFGHVTNLDQVRRFTDEVMAPMRNLQG